MLVFQSVARPSTVTAKSDGAGLGVGSVRSAIAATVGATDGAALGVPPLISHPPARSDPEGRQREGYRASPADRERTDQVTREGLRTVHRCQPISRLVGTERRSGDGTGCKWPQSFR